MREIITTMWVAGDGEITGDPEFGQGVRGQGGELRSSMHEKGGCLSSLQKYYQSQKQVQEKAPEKLWGKVHPQGKAML